MRIGVISDTHIPERAKDIPAQVLDEFKKVDMVIHVGDLIDSRVLDVLKKTCKEVIAVRGNMDIDQSEDALPDKKVLNISGFKIGVVHGHGHPDKLIGTVTEIFKDQKLDMIIFGHSHRALCQQKGKVIYFNPGSPTDTIFAPYKSYGLIEINDKIEARIIKL
ncbi:MAG: metallophosphoesterase [Candidatus Omnitrophica bacterium]|nr:metallophosphoesterase [Candidatus Omnitrophota bacterium]